MINQTFTLINNIFNFILFEQLSVFLLSTFFFFVFFFNLKKDQKVKIYNVFIFLFPFIIVFFKNSYLNKFFYSLGQDSLLETNFDFNEGIFFFKNFFNILFDFSEMSYKKILLLLLSSSLSAILIFYAIVILTSKNSIIISKILKTNNFFTIIFLAVILFQISNLALKKYTLGKNLSELAKAIEINQKDFKIAKKIQKPKSAITIYIGESNAALNFSLYGYPFATTPWLDNASNDKNFIKFNKVYTKHTHSNEALLSSLSICPENNPSCDFIYDKFTTFYKPLSQMYLKFLSSPSKIIDNDLKNSKNFIFLVNILKKANIETNLFSSQGLLDTQNFGNRLSLDTKYKILSHKDNKEKYLGNEYVPKIKDKEFFKNEFCQSNKIINKDLSVVNFLQGYAGHGHNQGYINFIDKNYKKNFQYDSLINAENLLGKEKQNFELYSQYDTAINYVDSSLKLTSECFFKKTKEDIPAFFIYFSDHGESPASGKGHSALDATYEMLHVPFILIYNKKAEENFSEEIKFLKSIKNKEFSSDLISNLILFIFGIDIQDSNGKPIYKHTKFSSANTQSLLQRYLLNNEKKEIFTFWNDEEHNSNVNKNIKQKIDNDKDFDVNILAWQYQNYLKKINKNINICQHRANSFFLQFKASLATSCFETDIFFQNGRPNVMHNIELDTNMNFDLFLKSSFNFNSVWMDVKNLKNDKVCNPLHDWLNENRNYFKHILVEVPNQKIVNFNKAFISCLSLINSFDNVDISYYLENNLGELCSESINLKKNPDYNCEKFYKNLEVTDLIKANFITFDFKSFKAVKNNQKFREMQWGVWHVKNSDDFQKLIKFDNTKYILPLNNTNLSNLN